MDYIPKTNCPISFIFHQLLFTKSHSFKKDTCWGKLTQGERWILGPKAHTATKFTWKSKHNRNTTQRTTTKGDRRSKHFIDLSNHQHACPVVRPFGLRPTLQFKLLSSMMIFAFQLLLTLLDRTTTFMMILKTLPKIPLNTCKATSWHVTNYQLNKPLY